MKEAVARPEKYGGYIRLNLNVPCVATGTPVIHMPLWCQGDGGVDLRTWPIYDVELLISKWGLAGRSCFACIYLAWTTAVAALALRCPVLADGEPLKDLLFFELPSEKSSDLER